MVLFAFDVNFLGLRSTRKTRALKHYVLFQTVCYILFHSKKNNKKKHYIPLRSFYNGHFLERYKKYILVYTVSLSLGTNGDFSFASHPPPLLFDSTNMWERMYCYSKNGVK